MIDFGQSEDQKEFTSGPVPPGSIVWVKINIQAATGDKEVSTYHPLTIVSGNNPANSYMSIKFEIISGKYEGGRFFGNFTVDGSEAASQISFSTFKAILRAHRKIEPDDERPNIFAIRDWGDLDGMTFPAQVKCEESWPDGKYINNVLTTVIVPGSKAWDTVKDGGEIITNNKIPKTNSATSNPMEESNIPPDFAVVTEDEIPF